MCQDEKEQNELIFFGSFDFSIWFNFIHNYKPRVLSFWGIEKY